LVFGIGDWGLGIGDWGLGGERGKGKGERRKEKGLKREWLLRQRQGMFVNIIPHLAINGLF
jgi:hypothetical protein